MATAQTLIRELIASGLNKSQIAKRVGRDSSLIGQIEKGKKPGRNLVSALQAVKSGATKAEPERRKSKSGEVAKVRQAKKTKPVKQAKPKKQQRETLKRDGQGRIKIAPPTTKEFVAIRRLREIAFAGGKVSVQLVLANGTVKQLYERGGEYAARLLQGFEQSGQSFFEFIREQRIEFVGQKYGRDAENIDVSDFPVAVGFIAIYTAAKDIRRS